MTNQQGAPEALRCAEWLEHIAAGRDVVDIAHLAATSAAELRRLAALVEAQQPAPSTAGPCVICGSDEPFTGTCGSGDPRALCKQPSPTPQADSQPDPGVESNTAYALPDFDTVEQHIYGACRRYITQDMLEPIHNLIREAVDANRASHGQAPAGAAQEPTAFIHWPINGPPRLVWYSQKALNEAILKTYDGHQPDVKLYAAQPASAATSPADSVTAPAGGAVEQWRPMETAPKDGTLVRLLVEFEDNATEDGEGPQPTIGSNTADNTGEDIGWQFAGWNWAHDCYTQGTGTPVGWLPMLAAAPTPPAQAADSVLEAAALLKARHDFLLWNRSLQPSPIESSVEYSVFDKALELYDAARKQGDAT